MNKTTLLITTVSVTILFSCDSNTGQKNSDGLTIEQARQDSIEESQIKGYSIKWHRGNSQYNGVTTIEYQSLSQIIEEQKKTADKEMWTKEKLNSTILAFKSLCKGGQITLHIERRSIDFANTKWFSIIVKDKNENELHRETLDSEVADHSGDTWFNIKSCCIDKKIKTPFFIYIIDQFADKPFKFEVTALKK